MSIEVSKKEAEDLNKILSYLLSLGEGDNAFITGKMMRKEIIKGLSVEECAYYINKLEEVPIAVIKYWKDIDKNRAFIKTGYTETFLKEKGFEKYIKVNNKKKWTDSSAANWIIGGIIVAGIVTLACTYLAHKFGWNN